MGLDQYLYARRYVSGYGITSATEQMKYNMVKATDSLLAALADPDSPWAEVQMTVAYWRKVNAVHQWFVTNCQGGVDDCRPYYVDRNQLAELRDLCKQVLADHSKAEELLPSQSGFFFGSTDYDEYYIANLEHTVERLDLILNLTEAACPFSFYYQSSW